jgi:hypothetical protein
VKRRRKEDERGKPREAKQFIVMLLRNSRGKYFEDP